MTQVEREDNLDAGLSDPSRKAADTFRQVLEALARPGSIHTLPDPAAPEVLSPAAAAVLLALADPETPLSLPARLLHGEAADWLRFHCNAPFEENPARAVFAVGGWDDLMPLEQWSQGTAEYPDRSATLIVEVDAFEGPHVELSGPGIAGTTGIELHLPGSTMSAIRSNNSRFPLGVDLIVTSGNRCLGLPRSTRIASHAEAV